MLIQLNCLVAILQLPPRQRAKVRHLTCRPPCYQTTTIGPPTSF